MPQLDHTQRQAECPAGGYGLISEHGIPESLRAQIGCGWTLRNLLLLDNKINERVFPIPSDRKMFHHDTTLVEWDRDCFPPLCEPDPGTMKLLIVHLHDNAAAIICPVGKAMEKQHQLSGSILRDSGEVDRRGPVPREGVGKEHIVPAKRVGCIESGFGLITVPAKFGIFQ